MGWRDVRGGPDMLCSGVGWQKEEKSEDLKNCAGPYVLLWLQSSLLVERCKYPLSCGKPSCH